MMPLHCRVVALKEVSFPLTEEGIREGLAGSKVYSGTEYLVLRKSDETAVVEVVKEGEGLFNRVACVKVISLPEETVFLESDVDVLSVREMKGLAASVDARVVAVRGRFYHVNFYVKDPAPVEVGILDTVPPYPSKLATLAEEAARDIPRDILLKPELVDITEGLSRVPQKTVMFPCRGGGNLVPGKEVLYLDEAPELPHRDILLVGCRTSEEIFNDLYGFVPERKDFCLRDTVKDKSLPTIVKCSKVKEGVIREGNLFIVPWGAVAEDVRSALKMALER
ncbi:MAG: hypothetical protein D6733_02600 [Methanobacteriota archaeon]|nr:MAG: hypothetical protein D6733_02600 [Euryarchaeota archaeon]